VKEERLCVGLQSPDFVDGGERRWKEERKYGDLGSRDVLVIF
jgi:hypothetical protein